MKFLRKISDSFYKISTGLVTLGCIVIFFAFSGLILPDQAAKAEIYTKDFGSPDTSFFYQSEDLYRFAEAYGAEGRTAYIRARFSFDVIWPMVYLAFLTTSISWLLRKTNLHRGNWGLINLVPLAGALLDFLENSSAAIVMARYPKTTIIIDRLAGVFTFSKWIFIVGSFVILVVSIILTVFRRRKRSQRLL
jgi:hypothetical protein